MRLIVALLLLAAVAAEAQTSRKRTPVAKTPPAPATTKAAAVIECPSLLGIGLNTARRFCDVLTGRDPAKGILVTIPPHRGPVTLSFDLHNRHTYSEELIKAKKAFRQYTATIGVLTMDNTLVERAVIMNEFRSPADLLDRVAGGAAGGVKAVAPTGSEPITVELPDDVGEKISILGEKLKISRPDGEDNFTAEGRPIAIISNVMLEYRPAPAKKTPVKKTPAKKTPTRKPGEVR